MNCYNSNSSHSGKLDSTERVLRSLCTIVAIELFGWGSNSVTIRLWDLFYGHEDTYNSWCAQMAVSYLLVIATTVDAPVLYAFRCVHLWRFRRSILLSFTKIQFSAVSIARPSIPNYAVYENGGIGRRMSLQSSKELPQCDTLCVLRTFCRINGLLLAVICDPSLYHVRRLFLAFEKCASDSHFLDKILTLAVFFWPKLYLRRTF